MEYEISQASSAPIIPIIYQDEAIIIVHKPAGMLVHRTSLDIHADTFVVQTLRDMLGHWVYPTHRLDRKTSGVLILAKDPSTQTHLNTLFQEQKVQKLYLAIVRGFTDDEGTIEYAITNDRGKTQEATTHYSTIQRVEVPIPLGKFPTSRYSFVSVRPETGRQHQIRKHLSHIFHPIIGDRPHGCNKQNKFFLEQFQLTEMMLHALSISFLHPFTNQKLTVSSGIRGEFKRIMDDLHLESQNYLNDYVA